MFKSTHSGYFKPKNPQKYKGNSKNIIFRSSWEQRFMYFLDLNTSVLEWASEEIAIPYTSPLDNKKHRYFPDFYMCYKKKDGTVVREIIEIKPDKYTRQPTTKGKNKKLQLQESINWAKNVSKWKAAQEFCAKNGMVFRLITEKVLFK